MRPQLAHGIYQLFPLSISLPISFSLSLFLSFSATFASSWSQPPSFLDRSLEPNLVPFRLTIFHTLPLSIASSLLPLLSFSFLSLIGPVCLISHYKFLFLNDTLSLCLYLLSYSLLHLTQYISRHRLSL